MNVAGGEGLSGGQAAGGAALAMRSRQEWMLGSIRHLAASAELVIWFFLFA